jgi:hypothetical protein
LVPALQHDPDFRERHGDAVDRERAERTLDFGGIRIERGGSLQCGQVDYQKFSPHTSRAAASETKGCRGYPRRRPSRWRAKDNHDGGGPVKVFVAGASGAVGKPIVRELIERGHDVVAMTSSESKRPLLEQLGAFAVVGDVFDAGAMIELVRSAEPEGVVNVASKWSASRTRLSKGDAGQRDPQARGAQHGGRGSGGWGPPLRE